MLSGGRVMSCWCGIGSTDTIIHIQLACTHTNGDWSICVIGLGVVLAARVFRADAARDKKSNKSALAMYIYMIHQQTIILMRWADFNLIKRTTSNQLCRERVYYYKQRGYIFYTYKNTKSRWRGLLSVHALCAADSVGQIVAGVCCICSSVMATRLSRSLVTD